MQYRTIRLKSCPHLILDYHHYRDDGSCKCDDPEEKIMKEWGYYWSEKEKIWKNPYTDGAPTTDK